jgi:methyl-accepting chemotaxis protein
LGAIGIWPYLASVFPAAAGAASTIAASPISWFSVITLALAANLALRQRSVTASNDLTNEDVAALREDVRKTLASQGEANVNLSVMIGRVEDKADKIAANVQADIKSVREEINQLSKRTEQQYEMTGQGQLRLRDAILARDAEALIKLKIRSLLNWAVACWRQMT